MTAMQPEPTAAPITDENSFIPRHIGPSAADAAAMAR